MEAAHKKSLARSLETLTDRELIARVQAPRRSDPVTGQWLEGPKHYARRIARPRTILLERHHRFIWKQTWAFCGERPRYKADELVGEATIAFAKAIAKFDLSRSTGLLAYAGRAIHNRLDYITSGDGIVRVPPGTVTRKNVSEETKALARVAKSGPVSMSYRPDGRSGFDMPERTAEPEEESEHPPFAAVEAVIKTLPERWAYIVFERMRGRHLRDIATEFDVTHERIRQIEAKAFKAIRVAFGFPPDAKGSWRPDANERKRS